MDTGKLGHNIITALFDTAGLLPNNIKAGGYSIRQTLITPYLYVMAIQPNGDTRPFTSPRAIDNVKLAAPHLSKNETVAIDLHKGFVVIQVPLPTEERGNITYGAGNVPSGRGLRLCMGLDVLNEPVHHDLGNDMQTSMGYLGVPGSGKSFSQRWTIASLAANNSPEDVKFLMIEVSKAGEDLRIFSGMPHLACPVITDPELAERALNEVVAQFINAPTAPHYKMVVCIDELAELIKQRPQCIELLKTLISQGRARNIIMLIAQQLSDKDTLTVIDGNRKINGSVIFSQMHCLVLGKVTGAAQSYGLAKVPGLHAEQLCGNGDLILKSSSSTRFAGVFCTVADIERLRTGELPSVLTLDQHTNTVAVLDDVKQSQSRGRPRAMIPDDVVAEGLIEMQHLNDDPVYREGMLNRDFWLLSKTRVVKELGRDANTFRDHDQHYIRQLYIKLRKRGFRLCGGN